MLDTCSVILVGSSGWVHQKQKEVHWCTDWVHMNPLAMPLFDIIISYTCIYNTLVTQG